jgi:hypothetical protein
VAALLPTLAPAVAGLLGGMALGFFLGGRVRGRVRLYWTLNVVVCASCVAADFAGLLLGWSWLAYGALGVMGGGIAGLRYGYSEGAAVWRAVGPDESAEAPEEAEESETNDGPAAK